MRLRRRFLVALVAVGIVLSMTTLVGFTLYRDAVVTSERTDLERTSESVATQLELVFAEKQRLVRFQADDESLRGGSDAQTAALSTFVRGTQFSGASVITANGTMTAISAQGLDERQQRRLVGEEFGDRGYFRRAMAGETYVSDPVEAETGNVIVTVSTPIYENGNVVGTLNAAFHVREGDLSEVVRTTSTETRGLRVAAGGRTVVSEGPQPAGSEDRLVANATVESAGWTVTTTSTRGAIQSQLWAVTAVQLGALLLVIGSLAGFGWWLSREYVSNVERLSTGFESLVAGDYGTRVVLSGSGEWGELESQFNGLSGTLAQRRSEVTVLNRVLRHNLRNAMTVVVGNADRIVAQTDDERVAEDARRIRRRGESLLDLSDHARAIESSMGDRDEEATARSAATVVEEVVTVLADEFPDTVVQAEVDDGTAWVPSGDLLVVVLDELGRNAVRHSDEDRPHVDMGVRVDDQRQDDDGNQEGAGTVVFTVEDDGPGLPPIERRVLTEPFVETPTQHGSGLGLWLVTWLVARVDGDIDVTVTDGTRVTLTVPCVDPPEDGRADASSHDIADHADGGSEQAPATDDA